MTPSGKVTNELAILYAMKLLGGDEKPVHLDDIVVRCFELAPNRFAMKKYPQYPDLESVQKRFNDRKGMMRRDGLVSGSGKAGWMLTPAGMFRLNSSRQILEDTLRSPVGDEPERRLAYQKIDRVVAHKAFQTYRAGRLDIEEYELLASLGCNVNTAKDVIREKLNILRMSIHNTEESPLRSQLDGYLNYCEELLLREMDKRGA